MTKYLIVLICISVSSVLYAQNVGIGTTTPVEKLDISGNINLSGTIKTNGIDGLPNQVLMKNSSGNLVWGHLSEYKNFVTFTTVGYNTWIVPAGVTKILVEAWGGGGGASPYGGGGGAGYISAVFPVTPGGILNYNVGDGGLSGFLPTGGFPSGATIGSYSISATPGGAATTGSQGYEASAGSYYVTPAVSSFYIQVGEAGGANKFEYFQSNATTFIESHTGGRGGNAGNSTNTGGKGAYLVKNVATSTTIYQILPSGPKIPGGGAGCPLFSGAPPYTGGQGMVIIHY